jgi:hypothetical protein
MAPRVAAVNSGDASDAGFKFIFSVLKHTEQLKVGWTEVAKENGIRYDRNA